MSNKKVLVVDDEEVIRDVLKKICVFLDYESLEADNGEQAWELWKAHLPELTISDIYMPKLNGIQLLRQIRRENSSAKVLLITGYSHYRQLVEDSKSKPSDYLEKPFEIQEMAGKIKILMESVPIAEE